MSKVQFFIHCTNFLDHYNFLNIFLKNNKFGIDGKPRLSEILQWKIFWKRRRIKAEKKEDENFHLFTYNSYKLQSLVTKNHVLIMNM